MILMALILFVVVAHAEESKTDSTAYDISLKEEYQMTDLSAQQDTIRADSTATVASETQEEDGSSAAKGFTYLAVGVVVVAVGYFLFLAMAASTYHSLP